GGGRLPDGRCPGTQAAVRSRLSRFPLPLPFPVPLPLPVPLPASRPATRFPSRSRFPSRYPLPIARIGSGGSGAARPLHGGLPAGEVTPPLGGGQRRREGPFELLPVA